MLRTSADRRPSGFVEPCRPSKASAPPSGPEWVHEIKHDGFRLLVRREGPRVRCFTRGGYDWADRFPAIVEAASRLRAQSFLIDGEVIVCRPDGLSDFDALRYRRGGYSATLVETTRRLTPAGFLFAVVVGWGRHLGGSGDP
jgi:bifunctional non-homologous end joining protein LigD